MGAPDAGDECKPVFISYVRSVRRSEAVALRDLLGEDVAFLDERDLDSGEEYPPDLFRAVAGARVIVLFADAAYFTRWYCLREYRIARAKYDAGGASLDHVVVVLPPNGTADVLDRLPPSLRTTNWPTTSDLGDVASLVEQRRKTLTNVILEGDAATRLLEQLAGDAAVPPPANLLGTCRFPLDLSPSIGDRFVGRASLLERILFDVATIAGGAGAAALTASLAGTGGIGKTRVALEFVWRYGPRHFPGGVFWIDASAGDRRERQLHGVLRALVTTTPPLQELQERGEDLAELLREAISVAATSAPILWVIDNFPEPPPGASPDPIERWCPVGLGKVSVLVTTRMVLSDPALTRIDVPVLERMASINLLGRDLPNAIDNGVANDVASWVGDLPLPLEILNRALILDVCTISDLSTRARSAPTTEVDSLYDALRPHVPEGALRGVVETMRLTIDRLPNDAQELAAILAELAPAPVPSEFLNALGGAAPVAARAMLVARSLLGRRVDEVYGAMHRVVADCIRAVTIHDGTSHAVGPRARAISLLTELTPATPDADFDEHLSDALAIHGAAILDREDPSDDPDAIAELSVRVAVLSLLQGDPRRTVPLAERAVRAALAAGGNDHRRTRAARYLRAVAGWRFRDPGIRDELERLVDDLKRLDVKGEEAHDAWMLLGQVARDTGDIDFAEKYFAMCLEGRQGTLRPDDVRVFAAWLNLAGTLNERGKLPREEIEQQARLVEELTTPLPPMMVPLVGSLVDMIAQAGDHRRALALRRRLLADLASHPELERTALQLTLDIAESLFHLGQHEEARELEERVLERRTEILGADHPETLVAALNLALTLANLAELPRAHELLLTARTGLEKKLGKDHPESLRALEGQCNRAVAERDLALAQTLVPELLERRTRRLGAKHQATLKTRALHAQVLDWSGRLAAGRRETLEAFAIAVDELTLIHPVTRHIGTVAALQRWLSGDLHIARRLLLRVRSASIRALGPGNPEVLDVAIPTSLILNELGQTDHARRLLDSTLQDIARAGGPGASASAMSSAASIIEGLAGNIPLESMEEWAKKLPSAAQPALAAIRSSQGSLLLLEPPEGLLDDKVAAGSERWVRSHGDHGVFVVSPLPSDDDFARFVGLNATIEMPTLLTEQVPNATDTSELVIALAAVVATDSSLCGIEPSHVDVLRPWKECAQALQAALRANPEGSLLIRDGGRMIWLRRVVSLPTLTDHRRAVRTLLVHNPYAARARRDGRALEPLVTIGMLTSEASSIPFYVAVDAFESSPTRAPGLYLPLVPIVADWVRDAKTGVPA